MKFIEQSCEIISQEEGIEGLNKHIELCGRISYKSEDRITEDSASKFVDMLINNHHYSVLEHGTVYLQIPIKYNGSMYSLNKVVDSPWTRVAFEDMFDDIYLTTNYRVLLETDNADLINYNVSPTIHEKRVSIRIITSRAIANELVRHRMFSYTQESSRFCNYSKNKFNKELTFIKPMWYDKLDAEGEKIIFRQFLEKAENTYMSMIFYGAKPQDAREVLPLCTKTELIMTGFIDQWKQFLKLRCASQAHPQMRELSNMIKNELKQNNYELSN